MCPDLDTILPTKNEVCFYELQFGNGFFFQKINCGDNVTILWSHWYSPFWTSIDSAHGF